MSRRLLIREASLFEYDDIRAFYRANPDDHVMLRSEDTVKRAIKDGVFFIALDIAREESSRIIGACAAYTVVVRNELDKLITLKEAGGSLILPEYRGYGIHKIFHYARALHEFILDRGGFEEYFGAILCPNAASEKNILKVGFEEWSEVPRELLSERSSIAGEYHTVKFFRLNIEALAGHARELLTIDETGHLTDCVKEDVQSIMLPVQTLRAYRPILRRLAEGNIRKVLEIEG